LGFKAHVTGAILGSAATSDRLGLVPPAANILRFHARFLIEQMAGIEKLEYPFRVSVRQAAADPLSTDRLRPGGVILQYSHMDAWTSAPP
jgi:hypothetical protein